MIPHRQAQIDAEKKALLDAGNKTKAQRDAAAKALADREATVQRNTQPNHHLARSVRARVEVVKFVHYDSLACSHLFHGKRIVRCLTCKHSVQRWVHANPSVQGCIVV